MAELRDANVSTVLLGRFNPLIFSPEWLQSNNVIGPDEAAKARTDGIEVMAPNITSIGLGSMKLVVEEQRFTLLVGDEPLVRSKDFPVACFSLLRHTPVHAVGINYTATLVVSDDDAWHRLGDILAPKTAWGEFLTSEKGDRLGGLRALVLERHGGSDERWKYTRLGFDVQENLPPKHALVTINNHFNVGDKDVPGDGANAYKLIDELWDTAVKQSQELCETVRQLADAA